MFPMESRPVMLPPVVALIAGIIPFVAFAGFVYVLGAAATLNNLTKPFDVIAPRPHLDGFSYRLADASSLTTRSAGKLASLLDQS